MSIQRVALADIVPNRYRNIDHYRISDSKIDALIQSYENSGFWDGSIQARPHPTKSGKYEIAFGHHRIKAARQFELTEVGLVVAKRSDADMLRMMADENREEFKGDHLVAIETIGATVEAFGRGEIELPPVGTDVPKSHIKVAPHGATYTVGTVARFLGWTKKHGDEIPEPTRACSQAFEAYHARDTVEAALRRLPEDDRSRQATGAVLTAARTASKAAKSAGRSPHEMKQAARKAAHATVERIRAGGIASKVKDEATKIGRAAAGVERNPQEISRFVRDRAEGLRARVSNLEVEVNALLNDILPYRDQIDRVAEQQLLEALKFGDTRLRDFFTKWTQRFTHRATRDITPRQRLLKG